MGEIQAFLARYDGTEVSPDFISLVIGEMRAEALIWQSPPLDPMYPVVCFDALWVESATTAWSATRPSICSGHPGRRPARHAGPPKLRRIVHTARPMESLNRHSRTLIKTRGRFPNDEAAVKPLWRALRNGLAKTVRAAFAWKSAMHPFAALPGADLTQARG
ncbi:hypothetical protein HJC54_08250 [Burkholderia glumae]|nr:hypothetical protein [Burkholderia glumae]QJP70275.1 hypothetical protein HJC54_08250 [Burkholderia glumae]